MPEIIGDIEQSSSLYQNDHNIRAHFSWSNDGSLALGPELQIMAKLSTKNHGFSTVRHGTWPIYMIHIVIYPDFYTY
jgi:hypothetical protein